MDCGAIMKLSGCIAAESPIVAEGVHGGQREITIAAGRQQVKHASVEEKVDESMLPASISRTVDVDRRQRRDVVQRQPLGHRTRRRTQLDVDVAGKRRRYLRRRPNRDREMAAVLPQHDQRADVTEYQLDVPAGDDIRHTDGIVRAVWQSAVKHG